VNDLMHIATVELARFLAGKLPEVSADWWQKHVTVASPSSSSEW